MPFALLEGTSPQTRRAFLFLTAFAGIALGNGRARREYPWMASHSRG
jgi:hypothetical protein